MTLYLVQRQCHLVKTSPTPVSFTFAACNSRVGIHLSYQVTFRRIKAVCFSNPREGACEQYPVVGLPRTAGFNTLQDLNGGCHLIIQKMSPKVR